jgi:MFS family permease
VTSSPGGSRGTTILAGLFFFSASSRTLLLSLVPLKALDLTGSGQAVSVLFLSVSVFAIVASLSLPLLIGRIQAHGGFYFAVAIAFIAPPLIATDVLPTFFLGVACWAISTLAFELTLSLHVMARVRRQAMSSFEPKRVFFMILTYSTGPWVGAYLERTATWLPYVLASAMALLALAYYRAIGLHRPLGDRQVPASLQGNPLRHVRRFVSQPRLRLGWGVALGRAAWWSTFFIYAPIYAVSVGYSEVAASALVSAGIATVYTVGFWGWVVRTRGLRVVLMGGFAVSGLASIVCAFAAGDPLLGAAMLLLAAFCTASLDGPGNVAYLRAVRPLEREAMTGVFSTYRDTSQLLPPAIFAAVLAFAPIQAVFGIAGVWMFAMAWFSRHIPKRMR